MKDIRKIDKLLLILMIIFTIFGLVMIFSASSASTVLRYKVSTNHFFIRQLIVVILSFIGGFILLFIPTKKYNFLSYIYLAISIFLLVLVLVKGRVSGNAQSWFKIGFFNLQPSEFAKTAIIVFMAVFYDRLTNYNIKKIGLYLIPIGISVVMAALIAKEPDLGSAAIFVVISGMIFFTIPTIRKNFSVIIKILIVALVIGGAIFYFKGNDILTSERLSRFNFKNPCQRYREDTGYQVCNGLIAISNGGLLGVGLGKSSQKFMYLPESHTDFIFPIICEEVGALVGLLVIIGYGVMLVCIYRNARAADNLRTSILAYGTFWYLATHVLINLLGVLALIPLTGVPLPFLSYGGSFTFNAILMIFIVERVSIENKKNKFSREIAKISN